MAEESNNIEGQEAPTTVPAGEVDYEALYNKEKKYAQSLRIRAQEAESKNDKLSLASEEQRQEKLIAEGKKDDLLAEYKEKTKALQSELSNYKAQESAQKSKLLESIPENERAYYENMNLEQLQHFVSKSKAKEVSNPTEAIQGRTNNNVNIDSFMKESDSFKRDNYSDLLRAYDRKSVRKIKAR